MKLAPAVLALAALAIAAPSLAAGVPVEYAARHILVAYRGATRSTQTRTKEEARGIAAKAAQSIKDGRPFEEVARQVSDDKTTGAQGGFLGFFPPEQMDPRFSAAVAAAKDGELVSPVESDLGFHVIQRLSNAEGLAILSKGVVVLRGAVFGWKGAARSTEARSKELALDDAKRAIEALAVRRDFTALPAPLGARSFAVQGFQPAVLRKGTFLPAYRALEEASLALAVGALSTTPVETPEGFVVVERLPYYRTHVEHLVVVHKDAPGGAGAGTKRTKEQARARAAEALAKVQADPASWPAVVAAYSDEPGAAARQGSLGAIEPGAQFVPAFVDAVLTLAPGTFSGLVETEFGWHVIRRVD